MCILFSFPASGGAADELNLVREDVVLVNSKSAQDLSYVTGFDVAIGYVKASDALSDGTETRILQSLTSLYESSKVTGKTVVLYVEGIDAKNDAVKLQRISKKLSATVQDAWRLVFPNKKNGDQPEVRIETSLEAVTGIVDATPAARTGQDIAASIEAMSAAAAVPTSEATSDLEAKAAAACVDISDDFFEEIQSSIAVLGTASIEEISAIVSTAVENVNRDYSDVLTTFAGTNALKAASYRTRARLAHTLHAPFRRFVDNLLVQSGAAFEALAKKVPPNSELGPTLERRAASVVANARKEAKQLQRDFVAMVCDHSQGLFAPQPFSGTSLRPQPWFGCASDVDELQARLEERCRDRVRSLFLLGAYNPYIRDRPWAPTHINFNYLIDPRALALGLEYNKLYDEHVEGPAINRALPLVIPGVAQVAFDPNDHPVAQENKPWWQVLIDYYRD
jgi:hypothetical protein